MNDYNINSVSGLLFSSACLRFYSTVEWPCYCYDGVVNTVVILHIIMVPNYHLIRRCGATSIFMLRSSSETSETK